MVDFILKHKDKYPIAKIIGMLRDLNSLDKVWFSKCDLSKPPLRSLDENVVEALLDEEFRDELNREYGWKIYDIECRLDGKCIEGGIIVSKYGLSIEEILADLCGV